MITFENADTYELHTATYGQAMMAVRYYTHHCIRPEAGWTLYTHPETVDGLYCYGVGQRYDRRNRFTQNFYLYINRGAGRKELYLNVECFNLAGRFIGQQPIHITWD